MEILPQAFITHYGLTVGAKVAPFVRFLLWFFFPIAYPIRRFLDWMLGKGHAALLRRAESKTFVYLHGNEESFFVDKLVVLKLDGGLRTTMASLII
ncbi:hypothetical protein R6Q57_005761 [Mikania cordata]